MSNNISDLANVIIETKRFIENLSSIEDSGSCNLDTVIVDFTGWKQKEVDLVASECGLQIGEKMNGWHKGYRFIFFKTNYQASGRTKLVESAALKLKDLGVSSASVWYKTD
ncbi:MULTISPECIES: hypothetical protein [unclassified Pedobacter]|uniref:hypothetical protein n=1 Tax=unclassified Pedobacter TaxID=2628915 RepID=UPI00141E05B7|nr:MULTISPECIES: hypothetical protein [unclassified Pedobacter]NII81703.1 hypothetical protein [Pedobacter sp. SG908]NMN35707.1 hypothetical protein [Pedobacter sp. SG918]